MAVRLRSGQHGHGSPLTPAGKLQHQRRLRQPSSSRFALAAKGCGEMAAHQVTPPLTPQYGQPNIAGLFIGK